MNLSKLRNFLSATVFFGGIILSASALASPPQATNNMGPGMMGSYGQGYGMGSGMIGGYGQGYGMGPGMMGGYGQGYGMGPGMMGGYGQGYGMGPGMMGGYGRGVDLNLTPEQRGKIAKVNTELRHKHWESMGKMHDLQSQLEEEYNADKRDEAALSKTYKKISELQHQMFEQSLKAQKEIESILTKQQREKLRKG